MHFIQSFRISLDISRNGLSQKLRLEKNIGIVEKHIASMATRLQMRIHIFILIEVLLSARAELAREIERTGESREALAEISKKESNESGETK